MTTTPYQFIKRGNLFVVPVGASVGAVPPAQPLTKPPDYSLWVRGEIVEPAVHLDHARMTSPLYKEVREDIVRFSSVPVTRVAFRRSDHGYVGVIDSEGTPYYFALDSRGVAVREADAGAAWKAFDRMAEAEHMAAVQGRRSASAEEMRRMDRELSEPRPGSLVVTKGIKYGKKVEWRHDAPESSWWRNTKTKKQKPKSAEEPDAAEPAEKAIANTKPSKERDLFVVAAQASARARAGHGGAKHPTTHERAVAGHEASGGIVVGHSRIRPSRGNEAKPSTPVPSYAHRPEHVIGGPGHRVAGEPDAPEKPRGTTSIWQPGDDERRRASAQRPRAQAPSRMRRKQMMYGKGGVPLVVLQNYAAEYRRVGHELWLQLNDGESELDPPRPEDAPVGKAVKLDGRAKNRKPSDFDQGQLKVGTKHEMEHTSDEGVARRIAMDHLAEEPEYYERLKCVEKALPRKSKEAPAKKAPSRKASKKQAGAGGKTRYTYPQEKKGGGSKQQKPTPLVVVHDDTKHADPAELANQLGVSVRTLQRAARRLGSDGFVGFMRSRLKRFAAKHRLDPDYWGTLYATLAATPGSDVAKSDGDAESKKFGGDVNATAAAVPHDHPERFGDRKVFIHHVHHEMKKRGMFSGDLDEFKKKVVHAHQKGHLEAARADLVSAMHPRSVEQSETKANGATFHFISNVKHDPEAEKKLPAEKKPASKLDAARAASANARDATARAEKTRAPEDHLAAMTAHHQAGVAHQKATGKVSHKEALRHFDQSMVHLKAAKSKS